VDTRAREQPAPIDTKEPAMAAPVRSLSRPRHGTVIAGVCAGIADHFGWSRGLVRALFLLSCLLPGPQFVAYIVLWIIMPKRAY
jgi:phage shock protein C